MGLFVGLAGCHHPSVTAIALDHECDHKFAFLYDPCKERAGIPFYLPKPLLIVAKNFRNIEETKVGLTDGAPIPNFFDDQAKYADLNARTNFAGLDGNAASGTPATTSGAEQFPTGNAQNLATAAPAHVYSGTGAPISPATLPPDGLKPDAFYSYHIVFVPDLTQKYALNVSGGVGEIRAAMNLVNGWQFTGLGPYYMKDSSTAQNTLATGITANLAASGVADVVRAVANLNPAAAGVPGAARTQTGLPGGAQAPQPVDASKVQAVADALRQLNPKFIKIPAYAEISVYEPYLTPEGTMEWRLICEKSYDRNVVATNFAAADVMNLLKSATVTPPTAPTLPPTGPSGQGPAGAGSPTGGAATGGPGGGPAPGGGGSQPDQAAGIQPGMPLGTDGVAPPPEVPNEAQPPAGNLPQPKPPTPAPGPSARVRSTTPVPRSGDVPTSSGPPPLRGPRVSAMTPAVPLRAPDRAATPGVRPKADHAIVRSQAIPPDVLNARGVADALAHLGGVQAVILSLAPAVAVPGAAQPTSSNAHPVINVQGLPPNATIELRRDQQVVNTLFTGPMVPTALAIADNVGVPNPGSFTYEIVQVGPNQTPVTLGRLAVQVLQGTGSAATTNSTPAPATLSGAASTAITKQFLNQFDALMPPHAATASTAPPSTAPTPAAAPASGNHVTLNQFFGRTKIAGVQPTAAQQPFSLFNRHKRKTIQTLALTGVDANTAASTAPALPTAPTNIAPSPVLTP
jgi:hypothetical protein